MAERGMPAAKYSVGRPPRWVASGCILALLSAGCGAATDYSGDCGPALEASTALVDCLRADAVLSARDAQGADSVLRDAANVLDSLQADSGYASYGNYGLILAARRQLEELFDNGQLGDSSRFNRAIDHIAVTLEWVREAPAADAWGLVYPRRTPRLGWLMRDGIGIYFEPELTVERRMGFVPGSTPLPEDAAALGEALWAYRRMVTSVHGEAAVWELLYSSRSCLQSVSAPRTSAEAQGAILGLFTALYRATADDRWRQRGSTVARSLATSQQEGGVRGADTAAGYWFHAGTGSARVLRAHLIALLAALDFGAASGDSAAMRISTEGLRSARAAIQDFDTGTWTRPCLTGGYSDGDTHRLLVALVRGLHDRTGDPFWKETADRWESYANPFAAVAPE